MVRLRLPATNPKPTCWTDPGQSRCRSLVPPTNPARRQYEICRSLKWSPPTTLQLRQRTEAAIQQEATHQPLWQLRVDIAAICTSRKVHIPALERRLRQAAAQRNRPPPDNKDFLQKLLMPPPLLLQVRTPRRGRNTPHVTV